MSDSHRLLIRGGAILSMDRLVGDFPTGDLLIEEGKIVAIAPRLDVDDAEVVDAAGMIVMPGFVDTHRHVWQTQLRGVAMDWSLFDYTVQMRTMYSVCYDPEDAYVGNYMGAIEALNAGVTTFIDHSHLQLSEDHTDGLAQGLLDAGIRGVFGYGVYRNPVYRPGDQDIDVDALKAELFGPLSSFHRANAERARDKYFPSNDGLLRFGIATSEFSAFSDMAPVLEEMAWCRTLQPARISAHIGVGVENELHIIEGLAKAGLLGEDLLLVHGAHLTDEEIRLVSEHGASISTTPETELQMGMGYPVAERFEAAGGHPSLGVDICSNVSGDMFAQMRLMLQTQRFRDYERAGHLPTRLDYPTRKILEMGTLGGARALGLESLVGSLTPGKQADIIMIRTDTVPMVAVNDPVAAVVFYAQSSDIHNVLVAGRFVKRDGRLVGVDWPSLRARTERSRDNIFRRLAQIPIEQVQAAWAGFYRLENDAEAAMLP
ncbi:cytosine deaminase-like metal-dependent hydrolase [Caulobacter sp. AP07]|uniref:amidohydrolase family protein n=1 Tax=Caulobacter sp. AP07 TaxID=1144304 RepID=UPI0002721179|nr:amidohydrolase family protein [Caulobacter sp. AP07]EJL27363.1 cytosine deaminase-like metal-dependent hydrolase [Caulobacter sp. AP07]